MSSPKHHALLSASSANRWLSAPPLPRLEQYFPHSTTSAATEGTAAHALGEYKIHRLLGDKFKRPSSDYQSDDPLRMEAGHSSANRSGTSRTNLKTLRRW